MLTSATNLAVKYWLDDDEYKYNLEGDYTHCSIAAYRNEETSFNYFTLLVVKIKIG